MPLSRTTEVPNDIRRVFPGKDRRDNRFARRKAGGQFQRKITFVKTPADCRCCGVCCFSRLETYVRVTGTDWERLGEDRDQVAHFIGNRAYMRMNAGHCAALQIRTVGSAEDFCCSIYERRPQVCRDLERGSPECAGEIASKSDRVIARD